nr:hypothetical protein [Cupriavidus taiwanensis]
MSLELGIAHIRTDAVRIVPEGIRRCVHELLSRLWQHVLTGQVVRTCLLDRTHFDGECLLRCDDIGFGSAFAVDTGTFNQHRLPHDRKGGLTVIERRSSFLAPGTSGKGAVHGNSLAKVCHKRLSTDQMAASGCCVAVKESGSNVRH